MIEYRVGEVLKAIDKTPYWLAKETGISYPTIDSIVKNNAKGVRFEVLDSICKVLKKEKLDFILTDILVFEE